MDQVRSTWHVVLNVVYLFGAMFLDWLHPTDEPLKEREL